MNINTIVATINKQLAGEMLRYDELEPFLDATIDDINARLSATFPTFSEWVFNHDMQYDGNYNVFPDKYIRSVVIKGAAYKWYIADEEGENASGAFGADYQAALFLMQRDYTVNVPEEYQENKAGYAEMEWDLQTPFGIDIHKGGGC